MRSFTFTDGSSNKFWNIDLQGKQFTVNFGKIGTAGQTQIKTFADDSAAQKEHDKLVAEKLKKGYAETTAAGAPAAPPTPPPAPKPATKAAPTPAPVTTPPAPTGLRTFEYNDATSHKFWNIERTGTSCLVTYGRIGAAGQTQLKTFPDEAKAIKECDKLIAEKTSKGYLETTPTARAQPTSMREALEQALVDNPDDLASHMAYADFLSEQNDPLGEFISVQLSLEEATRSPEDRKKLQEREVKLLAQHKDAWFGELAPLLFAKPKKKADYDDLEVKSTFRRGWLDSLEILHYKVETTRLLAKSPQIKLLRRLVLDDNAYEDDSDFPAGPDIPAGADSPQLYPLIRCPYLTNVREFILGELPSTQDEDTAHQGSFNCRTQGEGALGVIKRMPKLEELRLFVHDVGTDALFSLDTFDHLRVLQVYHESSYPLARLAKNPSLGQLTHLLLHPHAMDGEHAYIRTPAVKTLVNAPVMKSLTHLQLRLSDMGDKGVAEIIASGILSQLQVLDLRHGCITDAGAQRLSACPDAKHLQRLDLMNNQLTQAGIQVLETAGIPVDARHQQVPGQNNDWDDECPYLFAGDIE